MAKQQFTALGLALSMAESAIAGKTGLQAFSAAGKLGMIGVKREEFEQEYTKVVASPMLRVLKVRTARENDFTSRLTEACLLCEPGEHEVSEFANLLANARQQPRGVPLCIEALHEHQPEVADKFLEEYYMLWPAERKEVKDADAEG